jgi:hypothetical protein
MMTIDCVMCKCIIVNDDYVLILFVYFLLIAVVVCYYLLPITQLGKVRAPGCPKADQVKDKLLASEHFRRNYGHDHFVIHSINQAMGFMNEKPSCSHFLRFICENCTKLAIDTYPHVSSDVE